MGCLLVSLGLVAIEPFQQESLPRNIVTPDSMLPRRLIAYNILGRSLPLRGPLPEIFQKIRELNLRNLPLLRYQSCKESAISGEPT